MAFEDKQMKELILKTLSEIENDVQKVQNRHEAVQQKVDNTPPENSLFEPPTKAEITERDEAKDVAKQPQKRPKPKL